jgi:hypothetical protein
LFYEVVRVGEKFFLPLVESGHVRATALYRPPIDENPLEVLDVILKILQAFFENGGLLFYCLDNIS